ncbi:MAG: long-chain-acyl-CoA synthetase [Alphaproteobacteria bacterium]|nr:long-chain-acyl-CoA synthetase [Alphaproteobacteria bacterium]
MATLANTPGVVSPRAIEGRGGFETLRLSIARIEAWVGKLCAQRACLRAVDATPAECSIDKDVCNGCGPKAVRGVERERDVPMSLAEALAREYRHVGALGRTFYRMRKVRPDASYTISDIIEDFARRQPERPAILFEGRTISYRELNEAANRFSRWALGQNIRRGDVVALLMENAPEYLMAWLGIVKLGGVVALLNTHVRDRALAHALDVSGARHLIVGHELAEEALNAAQYMDRPPVPWIVGGKASLGEDLDSALAGLLGSPLDRAVRDGLTTKDNAFYIYTSGTTGLPKAANFSHMRMLFMMFGFSGALNATANDRMYDVLPLYHSTGGVCAVGVALTAGGALILRRKFSAHQFWEDCCTLKATYFQYVGELCRYLLNTPPSAFERQHVLKAIAGNGLRPELWREFQERFALPRIVEFYGATEGNVAMLNYDGTMGAVGRVPAYLRGVFRTRIVRFDYDTQLPVRGPDGFCIECAPGEVGEAIGRIGTAPGRGFEGYSQARESEKKILRDVFRRGDAWFRTGDLMRRDGRGYFYFIDRIGDTFRWKGENVATGEVAAVLALDPSLKDISVYGVEVPGHDGRAGMAALVVDDGFDPAALGARVCTQLPSYARPLFLRIRSSLDVTGTFKHRKTELKDEGCNPATVADPLYWLDASSHTYRNLSADDYRRILDGEIRL